MLDELTQEQKKEKLKLSKRTRFLANVYMWMFVGLLLTGLVGFFVAHNPTLYHVFNQNIISLIILLLLIMFLPMIITMRIFKMSSTGAVCSFLLYSIVMGIFTSSIFLYVKQSTLVNIFFITATSFFTMSIYGFVAKKDLKGIGRIASGIFIATFVLIILSIFMHSSLIIAIISWAIMVGALLFTAYFTQTLLRFHDKLEESSVGKATIFKLSILGALQLYIAFIQIFISLVNIMGMGSRR